MPRILVIEDDPTTAAAIEKQLTASKHEVVCITDGARGLELATREYFDAITLDRMLPGLDGLAFVERLRERSISIPVLMISALSDVDERIAGLRAGGRVFRQRGHVSQVTHHRHDHDQCGLQQHRNGGGGERNRDIQ